MPISSYLLNQFDEDELYIILAIQNDLTDDTYINLDTVKSMRINHFVRKIVEAREKANKLGVDKINIILNKIDDYMKA
jgi:hypothetical protein